MLKHCLFLAIVVAATAALAAASSSTTSSSSPEVKVTVYKGPTECSNEPGAEMLLRIEPDYVAGLHFTVTVDESSIGSRESVGRKIESSRDGGIAPSFPVGQGKVVAGLDQGLIGLCRGSHAHIVVPPHLAYGRSGKPDQGVGGDATLRYDVEIVDVQPPVPNDFVKIDSNKDWRISREEATRFFAGLGQRVDLDALWDDEDANVDGYISWEEFKGPKGNEPPPKKEKKRRKKQQPQQQQQRQEQEGVPNSLDEVEALFRAMDVDQDGKLSRTELAVMFERLGQEMTDEFWAESDPDGDGYVTYGDFVGEAGGGDEL